MQRQYLIPELVNATVLVLLILREYVTRIEQQILLPTIHKHFPLLSIKHLSPTPKNDGQCRFVCFSFTDIIIVGRMLYAC